MKPGPVQYAWSGDNALAYQIVGDGPIDLVVYFGWMSNLDVQWESPYLAGFLQKLSEHARLIITDRRGWGCSERFSPTDVPPLETLADDLAVVLDAAGSRKAVVLATSESGMIAQFFAAAHADRTAGLVLVDSPVSWVPMPGIPGLAEPEWWEEFFGELRHVWGVKWLAGLQPVLAERDHSSVRRRCERHARRKQIRQRKNANEVLRVGGNIRDDDEGGGQRDQ